VRAHAEDLRAEVQDRTDRDDLVDAISRDHRSAVITAPERAMLDFAVALTHRPAATTRGDVDLLRTHGFDDRAIAQIVQITALFNYYNRIVDGLGLEPEPEWGPEWGPDGAAHSPRARS
jgi:uncharacterized peroxidase-related enzyme